MVLSFCQFFVGFVLLMLGANWFIKSASSIAYKLRLPKVWLAMIVLSFATSLPELCVVIESVREGQINLAIGNIIGSYVANLSFAIGLAAIIKPIVVKTEVVKKDLPISFFVLSLTFLLLADGTVSKADGLILLACLIAWLVWMHSNLKTEVSQIQMHPPKRFSMITTLTLFVLGIVVLQVGSTWVVYGAIFVANHFKLAPTFVGMTAVAIGTSLPEIVAAIYAAYHNEDELAVGTALGSNLFLLLFALPLAVLTYNQTFSSTSLWREFIFLVILTGAFWLFTAQFDRVLRINRIEGIFLVTMGVAFYLLQTVLF